MLTFHIIAIFQGVVRSYTNESIMKRANERKLVDVRAYDPRDFTKDKHHKVDDKAYGGGPGMVLMAAPILKAVEAAMKNVKIQMINVKKRNRNQKPKIKVILLSPSGKQFTNTYADTLRKNYTDIVLIAGRYEGVDARVKKALRADEVSIGPYTLTGGELPALVVVDAVTRRIPGALGKDESVEERRTASGEVYTRPETVAYKGKNHRVPKILLSGDHQKIKKWRKNKRK